MMIKSRMALMATAFISLIASPIVSHAATVAGRINGSFDVSPSGAATYAIPIWTPPGPNGLQPNLTLVYNSQGGGGYLGTGWSISGLSSITRCNGTYAQDGTPSSVTLTSGDYFCLDGKRLRLTSSNTLSTYGQAGTTYQTEIADFSTITANGTMGNGPSYFSVKGKGGTTYEYGNGNNSQVVMNGTASAWYLDKVTDTAGNSMVFNYAASSQYLVGTTVPTSISWTPSTHGAATYNYQLVFSYNPKSQALVSGYVAGNQVQLYDLLYGIQIKSNGTTVKNYVFNYTITPTTNVNILSSVTECSDAAATNCLAATSFTYQAGSVGIVNPAAAANSKSSPLGVHTVDIDGDGKMDLVYAIQSGSQYQWWVQLSTGSGFGAPISTGAVTSSLTTMLLDSFDGTNTTQLMAPNGGTFYLYKWNGSSFTGTNTGLSVVANVQYSSIDANGDGLADLVYLTPDYSSQFSSTLDTHVFMNTTSNGAVSFATPVVNAISGIGVTNSCYAPYQPCPTISVLGQAGNNQWSGSPIMKFDFDGDGRQDLVAYIAVYNPPALYSGQQGTWNYSVIPLLSRGKNAFTYNTSIPTSGVSTLLINPVNWNDDSCTDLNVGATVYISSCNGQSGSSFTLPVQPYLAVDWNSDGRTDLIAQTSANTYLFTSTGTGYSQSFLYSIPTNTSSGIAIDIDGDGQDDWVCTCGGGGTLLFGLHNGAGNSPDLLAKVADGFGNYSSPTYTTIAQSNYTKGSGAVYPEQDVQNSMAVVKSVTSTYDGTNTYVQTFSYSDLRSNLQGRGLEGFQSFVVTDNRTNAPVTKSRYSTLFPYTGMVNESDVYQSDGATLITHTVNTLATTVLNSTANNQRYFPYNATSNTQSFEVGGPINAQLIQTSVTSYTYDNPSYTSGQYGNLTNVVTTITDNDTSSPRYNQQWTTTKNITFAPNASTWCLGIPTLQTVTQSATGGISAITRTVAQTPDYNYCRVQQKIVEPNGTPFAAKYQLVTTYGYDAFGNIQTTTVSGVGVASRTTTTTWTSSGQTTGQFPVAVTNALNQTTTYGYDYNYGLKTSDTDPNGITISWQYDGFGRRALETRPDGTTTSYAYNLCSATPGACPSPVDLRYWVQQVNHDTAGNSLHETRSFYNAVGDERFVLDQNLDGSFVYKVHRGYDAFNRLTLDYVPGTSESAPYHLYTLDTLGRIVQNSLRNSSGTEISHTTATYAGRTSVMTDANSKSSTKIMDVRGNMIQSIDANGYTQNFSYDAYGSLTGITDNQGNALFSASYAYGIQSFKTAMTDTDLGSRSYTYDALGETKTVTDAKNQTSTMTYDGLSRPLTRVEAEGTTTWTWGNTAASYNVGQLQSVSSPGGYSESYTYDSKGRLSDRKIVSDATYNYDYSYSATTGLLDTLQYPTSTSSYRLKLKYGYQYGIMNKVSDANASTVFWQANSVNALGQVTQEALGNGVLSSRAYDPNTGWLQSIQAGVGAGTGIQNEAYLFDKVGNLQQRQDNKQGLTENFYYDNVYRLTSSTLNGTTNISATYDLLGNITHRSDAGTYNYNSIQTGCTYYSNAQVHAVRNAGGTRYCYDANGNMINIGSNAISWTSFDQPSVIHNNGNTTQLLYDANHQRWKQIATYGSSTETTIYIGGLMEKTTNIVTGTTDYKHYIPVGNTTVEYIRRSNGINNTYYATSDHLGSSDFVTCGSDVSGCSAGTVLIHESFSAFGTRRGNNWSGSPTSTDMNNIAITTRTGFTGQEMMDNLNLVNMNGRVYSPAIGRFISADPHVTDTGNTQNYNRYSYVLNNPLRYVDPTGFDLEEVVVTGCSGCGGAGFSSDDGGGGATTSGGDGDEGQQLDFMNTEKNAATNKPAPTSQKKSDTNKDQNGKQSAADRRNGAPDKSCDNECQLDLINRAQEARKKAADLRAAGDYEGYKEQTILARELDNQLLVAQGFAIDTKHDVVQFAPPIPNSNTDTSSPFSFQDLQFPDQSIKIPLPDLNIHF